MHSYALLYVSLHTNVLDYNILITHKVYVLLYCLYIIQLTVMLEYIAVIVFQ